MKRCLVLALLCAFPLLAADELIVRGAQAGTPLFTRAGGLVTWDCGAGMTCTWTAGTNTFAMNPVAGTQTYQAVDAGANDTYAATLAPAITFPASWIESLDQSYTTPTTGSRRTTRAMDTETTGQPCTKLVVPSKGSTIQVGASVRTGGAPPAAALSSSPMKAWVGKAAVTTARTAASAAPSVSVTRSLSVALALEVVDEAARAAAPGDGRKAAAMRAPGKGRAR